MDLGFSESQEMLWKTARGFLAKQCPTSLVRKLEESEEGYSLELWQRMAELGWVGLIFPEEYGGGGGEFLDLVLIVEEIGRVLVPGPFISTLVSGLAIREYGTQVQKKELLPKIASGNVTIAPAFIEPTPSKAKVKTKKQGYLLSGLKLFVPYAHIANWFLYNAETDNGETMFLVNAKSTGINISPLATLASDKQCEVMLDKVEVLSILGHEGEGKEIRERMVEWGALLQCAFILGGLKRVLEMTVDYAKERMQFSKPIATFQAIQHECADMFTDVDSVKYLVYQAACKLSKTNRATKEISMAKARASDASRRVCLLGIKIHGGIGLTRDYDLQLYFRRAKAAELAFGDGDFHREIVAKEMGL